MNVGKIICQHMVEWVKHPRRIKPFPHLTKHFCIKACLKLEKIPQITVMGGICNASTLRCVIAIHKKKVKTKHLKTKQERKTKVVNEVEADEGERETDHTTLKNKRQGEEEASGSKTS